MTDHLEMPANKGRRMGSLAVVLLAAAGAALVWQLLLKAKAVILALPLAIILLWLLLVPVKLFLGLKLWRWLRPKLTRA